MNPASDPNRHFPAAYLAAEQRNEEGWVERLPGRRPWLGPETGDTSLGEHNHSNSQEGINGAAMGSGSSKEESFEETISKASDSPDQTQGGLTQLQIWFSQFTGWSLPSWGVGGQAGWEEKLHPLGGKSCLEHKRTESTGTTSLCSLLPDRGSLGLAH